MLFLNQDTDNPFLNLALEEVLLKKSSDDFLILGINRPSVIIGKHQVAPMEANMEFITRHNIPVIRRITGGGAVYHDQGNINFTFIASCEEGRQIDFRRHTAPVIRFLQSLGLDVRFEGKNDIRYNGLKISGNSEHVHGKRVLHHGTLLYNASTENLRGSLKQDTSCYTTRAVGSIRSGVTNISGLLKGFSDTKEFMSAMSAYLFNEVQCTGEYMLSAEQAAEAGSLASEKYMSWEWNHAYGPEYSFERGLAVAGNRIFCNLEVEKGLISRCSLGGGKAFSGAAEKLKGCRHMPSDMLVNLRSSGISISDDEIFQFF